MYSALSTTMLLMTRQQGRRGSNSNSLLSLHGLIVIILACLMLCLHASHAFQATTPRSSNSPLLWRHRHARHFRMPSKTTTVTTATTTTVPYPATKTSSSSTTLHLSSFADASSSLLLLLTTTTTTITTTTLTTASAVASPPSEFADFLYHSQSAAGNLANTALRQNIVISLPVMYAAGLLTSVSPCVWGLLPLTMSYISTAAGERQDQKTTLPTLAFAAGLALVFCSLGVAAAELGGVFGGGSSEGIMNWITLTSNAICLIMGFKLLELINIPLLSLDVTKWNVFNNKANSGSSSNNANEPILIDASGRILNTQQQQQQQQQNESSSSSERGSLVRTFLLGGSSALVASPCATPVLTSILAYVAAEHNPLLGAGLLFGYTLGYATPLLWIAATGGQVLVALKNDHSDSWYHALAPWVTPLTGGILLWYGTTGLLTGLLGDPSLAALAPVLE